jgi:hypothetical protein
MYQQTESWTAPGLSSFRVKGLGNHGIFVPRYIGAAGTPKIENAVELNRGFRASEIARHKTADVFRQRHTKFARSLTRAPLHFVFECNLRS